MEQEDINLARLIQKAKIAEQAERYDDMAECMKKVAQNSEGLVAVEVIGLIFFLQIISVIYSIVDRQ